MTSENLAIDWMTGPTDKGWRGQEVAKDKI